MGTFPNKESQFTSENQPEGRGRPKGSRNKKKVLEEFLDNPGGKIEDREATNFEVILAKWINKAKEGSDRATIDILDRALDKAKQPVGIGKEKIADSEIEKIMDDYDINERVVKRLQRLKKKP